MRAALVVAGGAVEEDARVDLPVDSLLDDTEYKRSYKTSRGFSGKNVELFLGNFVSLLARERVGAKKGFQRLKEWECWPVIRDHYAAKEMSERDLYIHIRDLLEERRDNLLLAIAAGAHGAYGLAWADLSSGRFLLSEVPSAEGLAAELARLQPAETLVSEDIAWPRLVSALPGLRKRPPWHFDGDAARRELNRFFGTRGLDGFGVDGLPLAPGESYTYDGYIDQLPGDNLNYGIVEIMGVVAADTNEQTLVSALFSVTPAPQPVPAPAPANP